MIKIFLFCFLSWLLVYGVVESYKYWTKKGTFSFIKFLVKAAIAATISGVIVSTIVILF